MIPGLTDIYEFGDWLKKEYRDPHRKPILVTPIRGGLVSIQFAEDAGDDPYVAAERELLERLRVDLARATDEALNSFRKNRL